MECAQTVRARVSSCGVEEPDHRHRRLLRARRKRPCRRAAEQRYEIAAFHCPVPPVLSTERIAHLSCGRRLLHCGISIPPMSARVIHVASRPQDARGMSAMPNSVQTFGTQQNDATCHEPTYAVQQTTCSPQRLFDHLVGAGEHCPDADLPFAVLARGHRDGCCRSGHDLQRDA